MTKFLLLFIIVFLIKSNCLFINHNIRKSRNLKEIKEEEELSDDIIILHTNDVHCSLMSNIGYDGLMLYKKELQKKYKYILTVDVGDHAQGDPIGLLSKGKEIINIMNKIGYDIALLGNHEFDYGLEVLYKNEEKLNCGYICANFCYKKNKTSIFPEYKIVEIGGKKIGFIGILSPQTLTKTYLIKILDEKGEFIYDFLTANEGEELYNTTQKYIDEIKNKGADYIIILSHLGNDDDNSPNEYTSIKLLSHINGVDAILDGHTHKVYTIKSADKDGKNFPITQTGTKLSNIGVLKIKTNGTILSEIISEIPEPEEKDYAEKVKRNNKERWVDIEMKNFINEIIDSYSDALNEIIGYIDYDLILNFEPFIYLSTSEESGLLNLITDAIRDKGKGEINIINSGSIRADLKKGNITYKDIIHILPFFKEIIIKEILGKDILDALEYGVRYLPKKSSKFPHVSGISFKVDLSIESTVEVDDEEKFVKVNGARRVYDVKVGKEDLNLNRKYRVSIDNYIGTGGDGYSMFAKYEEVDTTLSVLYEALITFIKEKLNGKIPDYYKTIQGRIIINPKKSTKNRKSLYLINITIIIIICCIIILIIRRKKRKFFFELVSSELESENVNNSQEKNNKINKEEIVI